jgi:hypothetical protein
MTATIDARLVGRVAAAVSAGTMLVALGVALAAASAARDWLHFGFAGVPSRLTEALSILANNARMAAAPAVAALLIQTRRLAESESRDRDRLVLVLRALEQAAGAALLLAVLFNLAVVGVSIGAYGTRVMVAIMPHGPFELAAYSTVLSLYLRVRREALPLRGWAAHAGLALVLLAVAAVLETFVSG